MSARAKSFTNCDNIKDNESSKEIKQTFVEQRSLVPLVTPKPNLACTHYFTTQVVQYFEYHPGKLVIDSESNKSWYEGAVNTYRWDTWQQLFVGENSERIPLPGLHANAVRSVELFTRTPVRGPFITNLVVPGKNSQGKLVAARNVTSEVQPASHCWTRVLDYNTRDLFSSGRLEPSISLGVQDLFQLQCTNMTGFVLDSYVRFKLVLTVSAPVAPVQYVKCALSRAVNFDKINETPVGPKDSYVRLTSSTTIN